MNENEFENLLQLVCERLTSDVRTSIAFNKPADFEKRTRERLNEALGEVGERLPIEPVAQGFPDIVAGRFGVEVKATEGDTWRSIANSVSEGQRVQNVDRVYLVFGKFGGIPEVRWNEYGNSIVHVRTSHVPRFEVEIGSSRSLFELLGITYDYFRVLSIHDKMEFIRKYARERLKNGERLWWLEGRELNDQQHSLPLNVKIYMDLDPQEKLNLRAEATLLCPIVLSNSRKPNKYADAVSYMLTYRGVLCPQARDLFSAGSAAGKARGGNYVQRATLNIQNEMRIAANTLEDALFKEYWGEIPAKEDRIKFWIAKADKLAKGWKPSEFMFLD